MKTNLEKWNYYKKIIESKTKEFINNQIGSDIPEMIYHIYPSGKIIKCVVEKVDYVYQHNKIYFPFWNKRPSKKDIDKIKEYSEMNIDYDKDFICFSYKEEPHDGYYLSGEYKIKDLRENKYLTTSEQRSKEISKELIEKKQKEEELLNNGHIKCTYCGKIVPEELSVNYKGIARQYKNMEKTSKYCSKLCGVHDQMAHEG